MNTTGTYDHMHYLLDTGQFQELERQYLAGLGIRTEYRKTSVSLLEIGGPIFGKSYLQFVDWHSSLSEHDVAQFQREMDDFFSILQAVRHLLEIGSYLSAGERLNDLIISYPRFWKSLGLKINLTAKDDDGQKIHSYLDLNRRLS